MKKKFLFIIMLAVSYGFSWGQLNNSDIILRDGNSYTKILKASSPAKSKHLNAKEWVAKTFGDYKSVLHFEDDENYKLIIKGFSNLAAENSSDADGLIRTVEKPKMSYTLTIDCKDDKYRIRFEDISFEIDRTFSVLGSSNHSTTSCDYFKFIENDSLEYANKIMDISRNIEKLKSIDTSLMKKKELKRHNEELKSQQELLLSKINAQKEHIIRAEGRDILVRTTICNLVNSLSNSMEKDDDF